VNNRTYRVSEIVGSASHGIGAAIRNALSRAAETVREPWFSVRSVRGPVDNGTVDTPRSR